LDLELDAVNLIELVAGSFTGGGTCDGTPCGGDVAAPATTNGAAEQATDHGAAYGADQRVLIGLDLDRAGGEYGAVAHCLDLLGTILGVDIAGVDIAVGTAAEGGGSGGGQQGDKGHTFQHDGPPGLASNLVNSVSECNFTPTGLSMKPAKC